MGDRVYDAEPTTLELPAGTMHLWRPRPHVVVSQIRGRYTTEHLALFLPALDAAIAAGPERIVGLHEWTQIDAYDIEVQAQLTTWTLRHLGAIERVLIAARSPFVMMAIRSANIAFRGRIELVDSADDIRAAAQRYA